MTRDYETPGEYASLNEVAGTAGQDDALGIAGLVGEVIFSTTDMSVSEAHVVGSLVPLRPGHAVMLTLVAVDGVEYEVFVRLRED